MAVITELQEERKELVDGGGIERIRDDIPVPPRYCGLFGDRLRYRNLFNRGSLGLWLWLRTP